MTKTQILKILNRKIDLLILSGKTKTAKYSRLIKQHYLITHI
jgi:hypothetical protein